MSNAYGLFWNSSNGDRTYDADSFEEWLKPFFCSGIFSGGFCVSAPGDMSVLVGSGSAYLDGKMKTFDTDTAFTIEPASSAYPRIDTVVIERNDTSRDITLKIVQGKYSGSTALATEPVRAGGVFQLVLAEVYVGPGVTKIESGDITDTRADRDLCGYVAATIDNPDFGQWYALNEAQFNEWFDRMKGQLTTDAAGNLQKEIDNINADIDAIGDRIYPVGTVYRSLTNKAPSVGNWEDVTDVYGVPAEITKAIAPVRAAGFCSATNVMSFDVPWKDAGLYSQFAVVESTAPVRVFYNGARYYPSGSESAVISDSEVTFDIHDNHLGIEYKPAGSAQFKKTDGTAIAGNNAVGLYITGMTIKASGAVPVYAFKRTE